MHYNRKKTMKAIHLFFLILGFLVMISCEENADPTDFVSEEDIERALGINDTSEMPNIPSIENPLVIGQVNALDFVAIVVEATQMNIGGVEILTIFFEDENRNEILITIENPETRLYEIGVSGVASFTVDYFDGVDGVRFTTRETLESTSSRGGLELIYNTSGGAIEITAQFNFEAFEVTAPGVTPSRFVDFTNGRFTEIPVAIN